MKIFVALLLFQNLFLVNRALDVINIGAIFEQGTDEMQTAFKHAVSLFNRENNSRRFELQAYVNVINTADTYKLSRLICDQFSRGIFALVGAVSAESFATLHSYANTFHMPFLSPWFPERVPTPTSGSMDYAISLRPDYHQAVLDVIGYYGWKNIIYIYDSHDVLKNIIHFHVCDSHDDTQQKIKDVGYIPNDTRNIS